MSHVKASAVLPQELINEIQKYVQGESIYIPKQKSTYEKWGARSGTRAFIANRNSEIKHKFTTGMSIDELAKEYYLSMDTIKKIVYKK